MTGGAAALDRLRSLADSLAGTWGARAALSTTSGRERAMLRLFGVHGLDRHGRPLAGEVVDRYVRGSAERLAGGVALPFAMALVEYDVPLQELALDVASGAIDLALEAELLSEPERRSAAEHAATLLAASALERIDANRTAHAELLSVLGEPARPWVGVPLSEALVGGARGEVLRLAEAGADVVRVSVPAGRELTDRLYDAGAAVAAWRPRDLPAPDDAADVTSAPAGSQRGLAELREAADEAAADRRSYVRLASSSPPLAGPEQAVVAAFERLDIVEVDPLAEIVDASVDPDRALADHAFANLVHRRAGSLVIVGPGPLVVAPDIRRGLPSGPATRAGRTLALQLLAVGLAHHHGLAPEQVIVGALPEWLAEEHDPTAQALAQVWLRRALFPGHPLGFQEPLGGPPASATWSFVLAAVLPIAGETALVMRRVDGDPASAIAATKTAATVADATTRSLEPWVLRGPARDAADAALASAIETLSHLADEGWGAILGEPIGGADRPRLGADAVVERSEAFDPFAAADAASDAEVARPT